MTIPNIITFIRFLMLPFYVYFLFNHKLLIAAVFYLIAALSDILDGYLARRLDQTSNLGKIIDPLADKLIVIISLVYLGYKNIFPLWGVIILLLKELLMLIVGSYFLSKKVEIISSRFYGKGAMVIISLSILMALLNLPFYSLIFWGGFILSLVAGLDYFLYYAKHLIKRF